MASELREGDVVVLNEGRSHALTSVRFFRHSIAVYDFRFEPDLPVAAASRMMTVKAAAPEGPKGAAPGRRR